MADDSLPPSLDLRDPAGSIDASRTTATADSETNEGDADASLHSPAGQPPAAPSSAPRPEVQKQVEGVLSSEIGIATLLNRLKQSIASAKEFALFLKKRADLEEHNAAGLKKVCRATQDSIRRPEHRTGTFSQAYEEMVYIHERMAENGSHFAASLQQMHDDLVDAATAAERSRKTWKTNGLAAEQKVADLEQAMRKCRSKLDTLAEDYERVRTGESRQTGKVLNAFKNKSAADQEMELKKKVEHADQNYRQAVETYRGEKQLLETTTRPDAVHQIRNHVRELDAGLGLQMQKFAAFNEKLLLSNGLSVSPLRGPGSDSHPASRSLRHAVLSIDNERDLDDFLAGHHTRVPAHAGDVKYERHPTLEPPSHFQGGPPPPAPVAIPPPSSSSAAAAAAPPPPSMGQSMSPGGHEPPRPFAQPPPPHQHQRSFSSSQDAPQLGALPFQGGSGGAGVGQQPPPFSAHERQTSAAGGTPTPTTPSAALNPVFGVHLAHLYERDGVPVPAVVEQCIRAVDLFGLGTEGIYRQSGSMAHIQKLRALFDRERQSPALNFQDPDHFFHDVNSVTGLLKQFFRDLPDPVLTADNHDGLVAAAKHDDDTQRRDSIHAIINALPDPNYATLRALCLHLHRVVENAHVNRMSSHNLALIFGPTLMGTDPAKAIQDAGWQIKVVDTLLQNTYQIFDED